MKKHIYLLPRITVLLVILITLLSAHILNAQEKKFVFRSYDMTAAEKGDVDAQFRLGRMYLFGDGVEQNEEEAVKWYTRAAKQGNQTINLLIEIAYTQVGDMYYFGKGWEIYPRKNMFGNFKEAYKWYSRAAELDSMHGQYMVGEMYHMGFGVDQNSHEAVKWFTKAAEQGMAAAQYELGMLYSMTKEIAQDHYIGENYYKAVTWLKKAAKQKHAKAQSALGWLYKDGQGVVQDYKQAIYWLTKAAEQGEYSAQQSLGEMYAEGQGVLQDYVKAYAWYNLAVAQGYPVIGITLPHEWIASGRESVEAKMTPEQIRQAQKLSNQLQYKINQRKESSDSELTAPQISTSNEPEIKSFGTGFIISHDGYIITCHHVIDKAGAIKVLVGDDSYPAQVVLDDKYNDLTLLKISGLFPALAFSKKRTAKMGQEVFTIGYPNPVLQGVSAKLTKGSVNSLTGFQDDLRLYQISTPVQPGNSGGPLLDMRGNVTGVIVAMLDAKTAFKISGSLPQNVNYAIKSTYAQALLDTLPEVSEKLLPAHKQKPFDDVVERVKRSVVMVVIY